MSVGKISFRGVEAPASQPTEQTKVSFKGQESPIDEQKSNATKYMIGATVLASVVALGIAGYKGHLGEGIQKFLGGAKKAAGEAEKAVEREGSKVTGSASGVGDSAGQAIKKLTDEELKKVLDKQFKDTSVEELRQAVQTMLPDRPILNEMFIDLSVNKIASDRNVREVINTYKGLMKTADKQFGKAFMDGVFGKDGVAYKKISDLRAKDLYEVIDSYPNMAKIIANKDDYRYHAGYVRAFINIKKLEPDAKIAKYLEDGFTNLNSNKSFAENKELIQRWFFGKFGE